jgi:hypothetical protein
MQIEFYTFSSLNVQFSVSVVLKYLNSQSFDAKSDRLETALMKAYKFSHKKNYYFRDSIYGNVSQVSKGIKRGTGIITVKISFKNVSAGSFLFVQASSMHFLAFSDTGKNRHFQN